MVLLNGPRKSKWKQCDYCRRPIYVMTFCAPKCLPAWTETITKTDRLRTFVFAGNTCEELYYIIYTRSIVWGGGGGGGSGRRQWVHTPSMRGMVYHTYSHNKTACNWIIPSNSIQHTTVIFCHVCTDIIPPGPGSSNQTSLCSQKFQCFAYGFLQKRFIYQFWHSTKFTVCTQKSYFFFFLSFFI